MGEYVNGPGTPLRLSDAECRLVEEVCRAYDKQSWRHPDGLPSEVIERLYRETHGRPWPPEVRGRYASKGARRKGTVAAPPESGR